MYYNNLVCNELNEISTDFSDFIYQSNDIMVYSLPNWKDPNLNYIKVTGPNFPEIITDTCRISIYKAEYIKIESCKLQLTKNQLNEFIININKNWVRIIDHINFEHRINIDIDKDYPNFRWKDIPLDIPIPDYSKLETID